MRYTETQVTSELLDQKHFYGQPKKIFICSTPRSGSYMLCRYMINAGLGVPHEYFNPLIIREIAPRLGLEEVRELKWRRRSFKDTFLFGRNRAAEVDFLKKYITALIPKRCQRGIFAAKIHYDQYSKILDNPVGHEFLDGALFVYLFREDLLKQAISRNFSYITGRWGFDDTVTTTPMPQSDLLDISGIERELNTLADEDRGWRMFLAKNGLSPITISFEQLCRDPASTLADIASRLDIDPTTLCSGYSEGGAPPEPPEAGLPTKSEVAQRYLTAVRQLHGADYRKEKCSLTLMPVTTE